MIVMMENVIATDLRQTRGQETAGTRDRTSLPRLGHEVLVTKSRGSCSFHASRLQFPSSPPLGRGFHWLFPGSPQCLPDGFPCPHSVLIVYPAARIILINCKPFLMSPFNFWLPMSRIWPLLTSSGPSFAPTPTPKPYTPGTCNTEQFLESATPPGFCTCCFFCLTLPVSLPLLANYFSLFMTQLCDYLQEASLILPD